MSIRLDKVIDVGRMQHLFDAFHAATGLATGILDLDGRILIGSGWQRICSDFHHRHPESKKICIRSNASVRRDLRNGSNNAIFHCPHGLIDA
ncbi:MAG TPA: PocR ligand-binding domain-containing protein, partial [Desulfosarcina sp.]|nr:PocR ligand-binding domain-containing protein [Desulfosarcina sp.]